MVTTGYALREASLPLYEHIGAARSVQDEIESSLEGTDTYALIRTGVSLSVGEEIGEHFGLLVAAEQGYFEEVMELELGCR